MVDAYNDVSIKLTIAIRAVFITNKDFLKMNQDYISYFNQSLGRAHKHQPKYWLLFRVRLQVSTRRAPRDGMAVSQLIGSSKEKQPGVKID